MHASSLENMQKALDRYVGRTFFAGKRRRVVDIGSCNFNGSYRQLLADSDVEYIGLDLAPGEGVDIVLNDHYVYPLDNGSADLVISGQMLEHCEYFWRTFEEMVRILAPDGYLILIAPSAGPVHRYPVDCYRFHPDSYYALAKLAECHVVAIWNDERGSWRDLVGVFSKNESARNRLPMLAEFKATHGPLPASRPELEVTSGECGYLETLAFIHQTLEPQNYFEIGVRQGGSLALASCNAIAVDPVSPPNININKKVRFFRYTSDDFFDFEADKVMTSPIDLAFIDGMHLFEYVLRDFIQIERRCSPASVIVIDDIFPNAVEQGSRTRKTRVWTGDVWKIVPCLRQNRPDLRLFLLDTAPTGMLVVIGLNPGSRALVERYNQIVAKLYAKCHDTPPETVIKRDGSCPPNNPLLVNALDSLRSLRPSRPGLKIVGNVLQKCR
ncbi:MAG: hypothetical protein A2511_02345 [Deltaproteobacteria bacterium RIFOXYD12_FULL_50_9]|nr:MAG: hypothetical protein A2511_02345 [Deltaproteobacteria bacterium RIFOXYD12_FULL_50_9]